MADELDSLSSELSDTSSSFLDSSMESSVSGSEAEDSGKETADAECKSSDSQRGETPKAKSNGKSKLASTKSLNKSYVLKQQMEKLHVSLWVFLTTFEIAQNESLQRALENRFAFYK